ncbi:MAG: cytochrome c oxidase accessory protein CcoG [Deltaproteobacteria bacterium]|nr:cytochrome c oxidase accessory protein CcoG [Deltaproteobacteria bacterium]
MVSTSPTEPSAPVVPVHDDPALLSRALRTDGRRVKMHPLETSGRFSRVQVFLFPALIAFYAVLPWVNVGGHPAVLIDIPNRRFFLFGLTFNSTDFYLAFFVLSGIGFSLFVVSALFGRVWCGYACPQTVYLEGVYRKIEALMEGPARKRAQREAGGWTLDRLARLAVKHALFLAVSFVVAHLFIAYFASAEGVLAMIRQNPAENLTPFLWAWGTTLLLYFNFAWFREQLCIVLCPYGRLQGALYDADTITVGYDTRRGEPRGKKGSTTGDCVDCRKCVLVCPTGIDIRNGNQLECVGCAHCIDACDDVMVQVGRATGLIRYDSLAGLEGRARRFLRPRLYGYLVAALAGLAALTTAVSVRKSFDAALLRAQANPRERQGDLVIQRFVVHVNSKSDEPRTFEISLEAPAGAEVILPMKTLELQPFESRHVPAIVSLPFEKSGSGVLKLRTVEKESGKSRESQLPL